jgi:hypothetical protein
MRESLHLPLQDCALPRLPEANVGLRALKGKCRTLTLPATVEKLLRKGKSVEGDVSPREEDTYPLSFEG